MPNTAPPTKAGFRDASIVTTRPVVPGPIFKPNPPAALTSGYQLDRTAVGGVANNVVPKGKYGRPVFSAGSQINLASSGDPWPNGIDSGIKGWTGYTPNTLREIVAIKVRGNYGGNTSRTNFGYRHQRFPSTDTYHGGQAGYPGPVPSALRPMWNNLLAIVWSLRVLNPVAGGSLNSTVQPANVTSINANPAQFTPTGTASLVFKGENISG